MKPALLFLGLALGAAACSLTDNADECPALPPAESIYFPLQKGSTWTYATRALLRTGTEAEPNEDRRSEGTLTWELTEVACDGGELRFEMEITAFTTVVIEHPMRDPLTDSFFNRGTVRGETRDGALHIEDTVIGDIGFWRGPPSLKPALRWQYPAASPDTLAAGISLLVEGQPAQARVLLVRNQGIVAWDVEIGTAPRPHHEAHLVLTEGPAL